ncbi:hypothetical protein CRUP_021723 [Coryphaenoides rupestris]|nr:hypothetical protein CRUP_021723 [Coryphaenoides rupestris]
MKSSNGGTLYEVCHSSAPLDSRCPSISLHGGRTPTPLLITALQPHGAWPPLLRGGSTYLIIQLNTNSILGDGPIIRKEIEYRASQLPWSEIHGVNMVTYKLWHLDPDTEYHISVLLTRPGEGGTGPPGPPLVSRTKCAGWELGVQLKHERFRTGCPTSPSLSLGSRVISALNRRAAGAVATVDHLLLGHSAGEPGTRLPLGAAGETGLPRVDARCLRKLPRHQRAGAGAGAAGAEERLGSPGAGPGWDQPMRALRGLTATDLQARQLSLQWESLAFNLTRCHTYSVSLCYRYATAAAGVGGVGGGGGGGGGGHNTTVRECLAVEHNASRFTLRDLPPYHAVHVRLSLSNPEGTKEGREVVFQTEEDILVVIH